MVSPNKVGVSVTPTQIERLLAAVADDVARLPPSAVVTNAAEIPMGYNNTVYRVECKWPDNADGDACPPPRTIAVRVSKRSVFPIAKLEAEVAVMRYLRHHAALQGPDSPLHKVPTVFFVTDAVPGVTDGLAAIGMAWVDGAVIGVDPHHGVRIDTLPFFVTDALPGITDGLAAIGMAWVDGAVVRLKPRHSVIIDTLPAAVRERYVADAVDFVAALQRVPVPQGVGRVVPHPSGRVDQIALGEHLDFDGSREWTTRGPFASHPDAVLELVRMRRHQLRTLLAAMVATGEFSGEAVVELDNAFAAQQELLEEIEAVVRANAPAMERSLRLCFAHDDLCARNMLVDVSTGRINGVVDWEWCAVGPATQDWFGGFDDIGDEWRAALRARAASLGVLPGGGVFWAASVEAEGGRVVDRRLAVDETTNFGTVDDATRAAVVTFGVRRALVKAVPGPIASRLANPNTWPVGHEQVLTLLATARLNARRAIDAIPEPLRKL
eukprot:CAMPEP_0174879776 /NCGR_PEP_ID=MMETSP1114-20130205/83430_1 /TAXON_ID=312471 /ORGANISM="Neobodo designis, Strain CCAP 1951/1" /LENGTH=494 /DNA_ID=CAMNT_0016115171 /DNA_START=59 /DNA_END=1544 /DNA_ORIENTATION=-